MCVWNGSTLACSGAVLHGTLLRVFGVVVVEWHFSILQHSNADALVLPVNCCPPPPPSSSSLAWLIVLVPRCFCTLPPKALNECALCPTLTSLLNICFALVVALCGGPTPRTANVGKGVDDVCCDAPLSPAPPPFFPPSPVVSPSRADNRSAYRRKQQQVGDRHDVVCPCCVFIKNVSYQREGGVCVEVCPAFLTVSFCRVYICSERGRSGDYLGRSEGVAFGVFSGGRWFVGVLL